MGPVTEAAHTRYPVRVEEEVGAVRRAVRRIAAGVDAVRPGDAELAATELATNLVRHARDGYILVRPAGGGVELLAVDHGPGLRSADIAGPAAPPFPFPVPPGLAPIPAPPRPPAPGGGGLGAGLASARRLSSAFDWYSSSAGSVILAHIGPRRASAPGFRWGAVNVPLGGSGPSGDGWAVTAQDSPAGAALAAVVVDGLGHGPAAHAATTLALTALAQRPAADPADAVVRAHEAMRGTRGGVAGAAVIDPDRGEIAFAGVGNIAARLLSGPHTQSLVSREGVLGSHTLAPAARTQRAGWSPGTALVLSTDGMSRHWDAAGYPGLLSKDPAVVAAVLYRDYGGGSDDVAILVVADARGGAR